MRHVCVFAEGEHTKGALRYEQIQELTQANHDSDQYTEEKIDPEGHRDDQGIIGTIYLRKSRVQGDNRQPKRLTVIVEY